MVRPGEEHTIENIKVRIMEVIPIRRLTGGKSYLVAYQLIDGDYKSPIAHFLLDHERDLQKKIIEVVEFYKSIREVLK